jgi:hypothetical protein
MAMLATALMSVVATEPHASWSTIEDDSRGVVMTIIPAQHASHARISDMRSYRFAAGPNEEDIGRAVCGQVDFRNTDDGIANFVIVYLLDDAGRPHHFDGPIFYGDHVDGDGWEATLAQFCERAEQRALRGTEPRLTTIASD